MKNSFALLAFFTLVSLYCDAQNNYLTVLVNLSSIDKESEINIIDESEQIESIPLQPYSGIVEKRHQAVIENAKIVNRALTMVELKGYNLIYVNSVDSGYATTTTYWYKKQQ